MGTQCRQLVAFCDTFKALINLVDGGTLRVNFHGDRVAHLTVR
jgi:hypothetical protein